MNKLQSHTTVIFEHSCVPSVCRAVVALYLHVSLPIDSVMDVVSYQTTYDIATSKNPCDDSCLSVLHVCTQLCVYLHDVYT